jgi:Flp pilus assembly pilin Flp
LIFGVLLPFVALVVVGGLLTLFLVKHGIGEVKGIWQTTGSKNPSKLADEKPSPQEFKTPNKPYKQSTQEEHQPEHIDEANQGNGNPWRW